MIHLFSLFIALAIPGLSNAITVPFRRQSPPHSTSFNFTNINVGDNEDIYVGTIYLADQPFTVQLDTGSADLWLDTSGLDLTKLPGLINTGVEGEIDYADGSGAKGPIYLGPVQFGDFLVQKQAFISAPGSNAVSAGDKGLLGVGPKTSI
ncbi:hypothetical protein JAAARDRAFT_48835 [Jaapia argillacea MUCL 33604]|uniref:Peptidase A1 domain-containing protein n=1 Tax=Jaapia argillacea MUCL 33604 TaxID=933084 RepID=A0A067PL56_9AGAM|nr:hypothetical protein JAAARDRAFT_48835 [Jaapia argillacea MUCL 33604]